MREWFEYQAEQTQKFLDMIEPEDETPMDTEEQYQSDNEHSKYRITKEVPEETTEMDTDESADNPGSFPKGSSNYVGLLQYQWT